MAEDDVAGHPLRPLLVEAYRRFRGGDPRAALDLLEPVIEHDERANRPSVTAGALWGLAGDCYFLVGRPDDGFRAYRRAITWDAEAGCLPFFACQVAWHRRAADAEEGLRCLRAYRAAQRRALRRHPAHFLRHGLTPWVLHLRLVRLPLVWLRLRRMAARDRG